MSLCMIIKLTQRIFNINILACVNYEKYSISKVVFFKIFHFIQVSKQVKRFNINNVSTFGVRAVLDFFYRGQIHGIDYLRHDKGKQILYVAKELQAFQVY